jgi:excisionase family DNA binding protein
VTGLNGHRLLTASEVADILGVQPSTVLRWARDGMPVIRLGPRGLPRWTHELVEQWVASQTDEGREW